MNVEIQGYIKLGSLLSRGHRGHVQPYNAVLNDLSLVARH